MRKAVFLLIFSSLVGLGMNLAHPITPAHIRSINIDEELFGILFASMNLGQFLMAPVWGSLGDRKSRKAVMIIGLLGYGISQALFGYFKDPYAIIAVRLTAGIFASAIISNALAHISINKDYQEKAKMISMFVAFNVIGSTLGYFIGGQLGNLFVGKEYVMMYIQALFNIGLAILAFALLSLPEPKEVSIQRQSAFKQMAQIRHLSKPLLLLIVIIAVVSIAHSNFSKYVDLYMNDIGYLSSDIGTLVFTTGLVTLAFSLYVVPRLARRFNETFILIVVTLIQGIFTSLTFMFDQSYFLVYGYTFFMVYTAGKAIYEPTITYHIQKYKTISPGILMGARQSAISLGAIIGPIVAGLIYKEIGHFLFIALSLLLVISSLLLVVYKRSIEHETING